MTTTTKNASDAVANDVEAAASASNKAAEAAAAAEEEEVAEEEIVLNDWSVVVSSTQRVLLPPLRPDEPVTSIRAALCEMVGLAHITNYQLVVETEEADGTRVLDEYGDLTSLVLDVDSTAITTTTDAKDGQVSNNRKKEIQLKLMPYKGATVREHVVRLQQLLDGNPPVVQSLMEKSSSAEEQPVTNEKATATVTTKQNAKSKKKSQTASCSNSSASPQSSPSSVLPHNLEHFFDSATGCQTMDPEEAAALSALEAKMSPKITITFLTPPTPRRKLMGDLAYLKITVSTDEEFYVTAIPSGFYKSKSTRDCFDPTPPSASESNVHHALLDCLCASSPTVQQMWNDALEAAEARMRLTVGDAPLQALHRCTTQQSKLDAVLCRPSWMVPPPMPTSTTTTTTSSNIVVPTTSNNEDDYPTFGLDLTSGVQRDWNEELQSAREMPTTNIQERLDRARVIHKVLLDFGDAAYKAATAIHYGYIAPMNPNEPTRSHVYLHNSIFVSRAVDAGVETFKLSTGDAAAKKAASRDAQCMAFLHRMDIDKLYTLATVLVDYLGHRYVCQSIVPGILQGETTHTLLYGAVEAASPLAHDEELHGWMEKYLGKTAMCATRVQPTLPLTDERLEEIEHLRTDSFLPNNGTTKEPPSSPTTQVCGPIEGKGIRGSDHRAYVLDLTRLTPRDANWVPKAQGGTGKWEDISEFQEEEEYITAVLRQELVTQLTHSKMTAYLKNKEVEKAKLESDKTSEEGMEKGEEKTNGGEKKPEENEKKPDGEEKKPDGEEKKPEEESAEPKKPEEDPTSKLPKKRTLTPEDEAYLVSLRFNVNVFMPHLRSLEGINDEAVDQLRLDEEHARQAAIHLWDVLLPKMTEEMRMGEGHQLPLDGKSMVEFLHQRGINCRYMGRLADLAITEEQKDRAALADVQAGKTKTVGRRIMPLSWLDLLEVEMIARAAKHVLDSYLIEEGAQTLQVIASFLSVLMSEGEETAGETEKRLAKGNVDDEDILAGLSLHGSRPIRGHNEVWTDIETQIARRFRYKLTLYNNGKSSGRTSYVTLLRRFCQRTGIRLVAKNYALGGKCHLCSSHSGRLTNSYPISPLDIADVVPLMKHAGALSGEGFVPCAPGSGLPSLHILLPDAKATFEAAHFSYGSRRALPQALELAQEAAALYQRVVDGPLHLNIAQCLDLTAAILFEAGEHGMAAANAARSLGLTVQLGGFDCAEAMAGHSSLSHILLSSQQEGNMDEGIQHLKAAAYLMELLAGPRYVELANCYYKIGSYYQDKNSQMALDYFELAKNKPHSDRLAEGMMAKGAALLYAKMEQYRAAVDAEKKAFQLYAMLLGEEHELTKNSQRSLQAFTKLAVEQGNKQVEEEKFRKEEEAAQAMANQIEAEEEKQQKKKKTGSKGKKKK